MTRAPFHVEGWDGKVAPERLAAATADLSALDPTALFPSGEKTRFGDWVKAGALKPGDRISTRASIDLALTTADGSRETTEVIAVERDTALVRVYNLEVASGEAETTHNYLIGEHGVWVHNAFTGDDFWNSLTRHIRGFKARRDAKGCSYDPDFLHDELEKYDRNDRHLGAVSPETGEPIPGKGPVNGRKPPWKKGRRI